MRLDVVDLSAPRSEQVASLERACTELGFFRIPIGSIDASIADRAWESAAAFFALPTEEKQRVGFPEPGYPYGYSPFQFERLARSVDGEDPSGPDLKESFSVGPDCGGWQRPDDAEQAWIRSPSLWPDRPGDLRATWTAYYRALSGVAAELLSVMAEALDLPADYFASLTDVPITSMRAIHYPAIEGEVGTSLRAGAHSDYGTLTILRTDDVAGLEIERDGVWHEVAPEPDTFVVNLGDSIAQWTNDRWRSTMHRVHVREAAPRQSFAFFHMANWDARIECLPTCLGPGESPRHEPVLAGPWLMQKFQATV